MQLFARTSWTICVPPRSPLWWLCKLQRAGCSMRQCSECGVVRVLASAGAEKHCGREHRNEVLENENGG